MTKENRQDLIAHAKWELEINVPIYQVEILASPTRVIFYLYGGRVLTWTHPADDPPADHPEAIEAKPIADRNPDLTAAAGVGAKTAASMRRLGITTQSQMAGAYQAGRLQDLMTRANHRKLGAWLQESGLILWPLECDQ